MKNATTVMIMSMILFDEEDGIDQVKIRRQENCCRNDPSWRINSGFREKTL